MKTRLATLWPRDDRNAIATTGPRADARGRPLTGMTLGLVALAAAACALLVPGAAYANTNRVELVNTATNLRADVMWASAQDGQNVFLWPNNASASQLFDLVNMGGGYFQIKARHSGKCLMVDRTQPNVGNGRRIAQYPCTSSTYKSAQWRFVPMNPPCDDTALCADSGRRVIKNRHWGKCLDTANPAGRRPPQQAVLQLWTCISGTADWNADNQIWKIWDPFSKRTIYQPA